jgi:hypothetical protein
MIASAFGVRMVPPDARDSRTRGPNRPNTLALARSRRKVLATVAGGATAVLGGCGAWGDQVTATDAGGPATPASGSGTPTATTTADPDAGVGSYGVVVRNEGQFPAEVALTAGPLFGEPEFAETVVVEPGDRREWDRVVTVDSGEWGVNADVNLLDTPDAETFNGSPSGGVRLDMDDESSLPDAENVIFKLFSGHNDNDKIWVMMEAGFPGDWTRDE